MSSHSESSLAPHTPQVGRKAVITRDDLIYAALRLVGPNRSISTLSLREIARAAGIAPNSFYRHFRDTDELAIALISLAGGSLRKIIGEARHRASTERSVTRTSVETFMEQLHADEGFLPLLLREGTVGSQAFKQALENELRFFEEELQEDLVRLAKLHNSPLFAPNVAAKAITRLVFAMGASALDQPKEKEAAIMDQTEMMVRMILVGAETMIKDTTQAVPIPANPAPQP